MEWAAVKGLQDEVREYRELGAIGAYELLIRTNGARFDALVTAEILDASRLAELRGLDMDETTLNEAVARNPRRQPPS